MTDLASWIGREEVRTEIVEAESLRRYSAALGETLQVEDRLPSLAHWACFLPVVLPGEIGADGHPMRGGFLPPVPLPRRMFAGAEIELRAPLSICVPAERRSRIADVSEKTGKSGALVLVEVEHRIAQAGQLKVIERQTIVYRDAGPPIAPVVPGPAMDGETWQPGPVDLFRFSAATFNSHRIHYDAAYARDVEGYPGLVVHGPFTAARLFALAVRDEPIARFGFRALAPLFAGQPIELRRAGEGLFEAVRCDGVVAMTARAGERVDG